MTEETYTSKDVLFSENQQFRLLWVKITIGIAAIGTISPIVYQLFTGRLRHIPHSAFVNSIIPVVIIVALILLFSFLELRVRVVPTAVLYRFHPFQRKWHQIDAEYIVSCEHITFRPLRDYGGWGIRYSSSKGSAYTVSGNKGVLITKKSGKKILLGSRQGDALEQSIRQIMGQAASPST